MNCFKRGCLGCSYCEDEDFNPDENHREEDPDKFYQDQNNNRKQNRSKNKFPGAEARKNK